MVAFIWQYLTTVIPYEKKSGPPSIEDLQTLTKILHAMKEDSEKVPSLLTDYILKVPNGKRVICDCLLRTYSLCGLSEGYAESHRLEKSEAAKAG
uniref:Uncharacterized protein n=1 Tax=Sphaerodactylus townsendi TaxID=933632 RepID=A0ACB8GAR5_9SAUR